jgi:hypothetical protein
LKDLEEETLIDVEPFFHPEEIFDSKDLSVSTAYSPYFTIKSEKMYTQTLDLHGSSPFLIAVASKWPFFEKSILKVPSDNLNAIMVTPLPA